MSKMARLAFAWLLLILLLGLVSSGNATHTFAGSAGQPLLAEPPFSGTIFLDPDIITASDPSTLQSVSYAGQGTRTMFDRRVDDWITVEAYLFDASFAAGLAAEVQINPEFGSVAAATVEAQKYSEVIGRLPAALLAELQTVWIHKGTQPFGGGNNNLLIHTGQADLYVADGILEETLVHEASHTSLDPAHASAPGWLAAQAADGTFISTYARDFPGREDIAESFLPYLAVRHRASRISQSLYDTIVQTIPHRIAYFDQQAFNLRPVGSFYLYLPVINQDQPGTGRFDPAKWYRLSNQFLGEGRALDTYSNEPNAPFMGETGPYGGQYWRIEAIGDSGYYRLTNQFLGAGRALDTYSNEPNAPFMGETGPYGGQHWHIEAIGNSGFYRLTNQFLGPGRALDTYSNEPNAPFMGETGPYGGQYWHIEEIQ